MPDIFYRDNDVDTVRLIADNNTPVTEREGVVVDITPGGLIGVRPMGSTNIRWIEPSLGIRIGIGDRVRLERSQNQRWAITAVMPAASSSGFGLAGASATGAATNNLGTPESFVASALPTGITFSWQTPGQRADVFFELYVGPDTTGAGGTTYKTNGTSYTVAVSAGVTKYARVRSVDQQWNRSGWTDWASTTATSVGTGAPTTATYITQTPDAGLSAEQALSALSTGVLKNTTGTGVLTIAIDGTDYLSPSTAKYQTVQSSGSNMTQRPTINFIQSVGMLVSLSDSAGFNRTNVTIANNIGLYNAGSLLMGGVSALDFKDANMENAGSNQGNFYLDLRGYMKCRLTILTGTPVPTADQTAKTTIYLEPYGGDKIITNDGVRPILRPFTSVSAAVPNTSNTMYDVFVYYSGSLLLELVSWTNVTTRATALTTWNGMLAKNGDTTKLYVGSFCTTNVAGQTEDSKARRLVWNNYNRRRRTLYCKDTTDSWAYTTQTWRAANTDTSYGVGRVDCVVGWDEDDIEAVHAAPASNATSCWVATGIGIDSTSANSALITGSQIAGSDGQQVLSFYRGNPGVGQHYLQRLEISQAVGTTVWFGDQNLSFVQGGMTGSVWA